MPCWRSPHSLRPVLNERFGIRIIALVEHPVLRAFVVEHETAGTIVEAEGDVVGPMITTGDAVLHGEEAPLCGDWIVGIGEGIALPTLVGLHHDVIIAAHKPCLLAAKLEDEQGAWGGVSFIEGTGFVVTGEGDNVETACRRRSNLGASNHLVV